MIRIPKTKEKRLSFEDLAEILSKVGMPNLSIPDHITEMASESKENLQILVESVINIIKILVLSEAMETMDIEVEDLLKED